MPIQAYSEKCASFLSGCSKNIAALSTAVFSQCFPDMVFRISTHFSRKLHADGAGLLAVLCGKSENNKIQCQQ